MSTAESISVIGQTDARQLLQRSREVGLDVQCAVNAIECGGYWAILQYLLI